MSLDNHSTTTGKPHTEDVFRQLSDTQWRFVTAMVENPEFTKKQAAEHIGIMPDTVYRWPKYVDDALALSRRDVHSATVAMRQQAVMKAMRVKIKLLDSEDEGIRSKAASEIIEWELGRATTRSEITGENGGLLPLQIVFKQPDRED